MVEVEEYLSLPTAKDEEFEKTHTRSSCSYENRCSKFQVKERHYATQYAHIYFWRLEQMRRHLEAAATKKWGKKQSGRGGSREMQSLA